MSGSFGAQVVLDPASPAALGARGGAASTIHGNTVARDLGLISNGLDPLLTAGPPNTVVPCSLNFMRPGWLDPGVTFTRASTATYTDSTGTIQTAAINAPRWDYAGGSLRGLLIEEARINLLFPSVLSGPNWLAVNSIVLGGSVTLPDGAVSATALLAATDTANTVRLFYRAGTAISASTAYVVSVYLRASPKNAYIQIDLAGGTGNVGIAYFDLTAGTGVVGTDLAGSVAGKSVSVVPVANGWYRCSFALTTGVGNTTLQVAIGPCTIVSASGDNRSYIGVIGQGVYAWGAQVEQGAFPTSTIVTTSAAVTRAQEIMTIPTNVSWYSGTAGTIMVAALMPPNGNNGYRGLYSLDAGGSGTWHRVYTLTGSASLHGDINAAGLAIGTVVPGTPFKTAVSYDAAGSDSVLGGVAGSSTATVSTPASFTTLRLGIADVIPANFLNGYLRSVQYWPRRLSISEMLGVTI